MTEAEILAEAVARIRAQLAPLQIILFGSRARGEAKPESDFDLMVISEHGGTWRTPGDILTALAGLPADFDVLVESAADWDKWRQVGPAFEHRVAREGRQLLDSGG